jgi:hypothetical protein
MEKLITKVVMIVSKYTTEVRFICEQKAGLEGSVGASDVDEVLSKSWNKVITSNFAIFDEAYREKLVTKVLKHYYLREIGAETVGVWALWMNTKFEEIMPYYNQLYESAKLKFEPFYDVDYTRSSQRDITETEHGSYENKGQTESSGSSTDTGKTSNSRTNKGHNYVAETGATGSTSKDLYSDTPQGALTGVDNETYLTNARKVTENDNSTVETTTDIDETVTDSGTSEVKGVNSQTINSKLNNTNAKTGEKGDSFSEGVRGKMGGGSYSKMLIEYRDTFINIDMMVIDEFKDLFFGLW